MRFLLQKTISKFLLLALLASNSFAATIDIGGGGGIPSSEKGAANGVAPLDAAGLVPVANLPAGGGTGSVTSVSVVSANGLAGSVATATTTPAITLSTSVTGLLKGNGTAISAAVSGTDYEPPITAGTTLQYLRGDKSLATLNSSVVPEVTNLYYTAARFDAAFAAKSTTDLAEGTNLYYTVARFDTALATKSTTDLAEGTNLYFTVARAKAAAVADAIVNGVVDVAPSQNAVFDALALKQDLIGYTPEDVANKDTDGTLAANSDTKYASQKATKTYVDTAAALDWHLGGNTGTAGTAVVGTQDAQPWTTIVNGIFVDGYAIDGEVSSIMNVAPVDGTYFRQRRSQVNFNASTATTTANFANQDNNVSYAGAGFDFGGTINNVSNVVSHTGAEHIGAMGSASYIVNFAGGGHTDTAKNISSALGVTGPYTIDNFSSLGAYANASQLIGGGRLFDGGGDFADSTLNSVDFIGGNLNVTGTSTVAGNISGVGVTISAQNTTTAAQIIGGNLGVTAKDSAAINGATSLQMLSTLQDSAVASGTTFGINNGINLSGTAASNGITGDQLDMRLSGNSNGGAIIGGNFGIGLQDSAIATSVTALQVNPQIQDTATGGNVTTVGISGQIQGSATATNFNGLSVAPQVSGSAVVTNFAPFSVAANVQNTATVTNGVTLADLSLQSTPALTSAKGLNVNITGTNVTDPMQKQGIQVQGGLNAFQYDFTIPAAATFLSANQFNNNLTIANGAPISSLGFLTNFSQSLVAHDDWTADFTGIRIGWAPIASVAVIDVDAGKTIDSFSGVLMGLTNTGGAGTLDQAYSFRAAGVIPGGGALVVNKEVGFASMPTMCSLSAGNCWAFLDETSSAENYLGKLAIGTSTKKVANSDTAFEIGNKKAFLPGRGTTAEKNALTAVEGMQFYDTDIGEMEFYDGSTWVSMTGGTGGSVSTVSVVTANGLAGTVANATTTPAITLTTSVTGLLKGNGTAISAATANTDYQDVISTSSAVANQFVTGFTAPNTFTRAQPSFSNISGSATTSQININADLPFGGFKATGAADPTSAQDLATKSYVDTAIANNGVTKDAAIYTTTAALPANVYNNGASGVGATLTGVSVGALTVDGNAISAGQRILVKNEATQANNGIYSVTATGSGIAVYVLTRTSDYNVSSEIINGTELFVSNGATLASTSWAMNNPATIVVGTTAITFAQISGPGSITSGTGIVITGTVVSLDTPTASTIGGVQSYAAISNQFINAISTAGVPSSAQVGFSNLSGSIVYNTQGKQVVTNGGNAAYTILSTDDHVRTTTTLTAQRTYTLPACTTNIGERHVVKNLPAQTFDIILAGNGSDNIDSSNTHTITPGSALSVVCAASAVWDIQ